MACAFRAPSHVMTADVLICASVHQARIGTDACPCVWPVVYFAHARTHALRQVAVYPQQCAPWLLSPESGAILAPVLQGEHLEAAAAAPPAQLQQHLLEAVSRSLQVRVGGGLWGRAPCRVWLTLG